MNLTHAVIACFLLSGSMLMNAQTADSKGSISGTADPGARVVVTGVDDGSIVGIMAKCDGTYKADDLKAGRYKIVEGGPYHATRQLSVTAGMTSHVDLGGATPDSTRACVAKQGK